LNNATLTVRKAYVYGKEKPTTKTGKERTVYFVDKLTPILKEWWKTNGCPEFGWVFPNRDGNPVNMNILSDRIIRPNCETNKMNWEGSAFYALRRASELCSSTTAGIAKKLHKRWGTHGT
jgi:integrase